MDGQHYAVIVHREPGGRFRAVQPDFRVTVTNHSLDGSLQAARRAVANAALAYTAKGIPMPKAMPLSEVARSGLATGALVLSIELPGHPLARSPRIARPRSDDIQALAAELRPFVGIPLATLRDAFIEATVAACEGNVIRAARLLGVHNSTVYRERKQHRKRDNSA